MKTLLVGFGALGRRLAPLLAADGEVFALRRSESEPIDGVTGIRADVTEPITSTLPAVDAMVVTLPPRGHGGYRAALHNLAAALPTAPSRTVFVSSTGVFEGGPFDRPITELDQPEPATDRSRELVDGERAAVELFDAVIVRPAGIYGPGREYLVRQVRDQAMVNHRRRTNRIHEIDLVRALELVVRMPDPPAVLHAVDAAPAPLGDVVSFIAERLELTAPPDDPAGAASGTVLDGSLLRSMLGNLEYPTYREGYSALVRS